MNKYQCQVCGAVSYSAASQENLKDNGCLECDRRVEMVDGDKMNADEIMGALKSNAEVNHHAAVMMMAADLIETLQAQLADKTALLDAAIAGQETLQRALAESRRSLRTARNELCLKCGRYREAHKGACDGCRWRNNSNA